MNKAQRERVARMLIDYFGFTPVNSKKLAQRITADSYPAVANKMQNLIDRFKTDPTIKDRAAYTFKSLDEVLKKYETNTEFEVIEDEE